MSNDREGHDRVDSSNWTCKSSGFIFDSWRSAMPVRPKGQCQRAGTSVQEPPSRSFTNPPSLQGFCARAVLSSRLKLRSAATLPLGPASFPEQTLLTLEALFQLTEDCISHLFCVLVEALTVL